MDGEKRRSEMKVMKFFRNVVDFFRSINGFIEADMAEEDRIMHEPDVSSAE